MSTKGKKGFLGKELLTPKKKRKYRRTETLSSPKQNDQEPSVDYAKLAADCQEAVEKAADKLSETEKAKIGIDKYVENPVMEDDADILDASLKERSESAYIDIAKDIVKASANQLDAQNKSKNSLKKIFTIFFICFVSVQYVALTVLLFIRAFQEKSLLNDTVIMTYISSVFLETLGAVAFMIRYAFASDQETRVLAILNSIIERFKKFSN